LAGGTADWSMEFPQHSKQVLEQLNQQRQLGLLCDCTFVVDGINFKAHKAVLAACSELFSLLFCALWAFQNCMAKR
uniref:BTB domain-containing protein n=1 Tax=Strix occidentalis caurina TaxID=311401 RepID=A0A8D0FIS7_STROC